MPLGTDKHAVISGDGSGINKVGDKDVTFEVKCPILGINWETDGYYKSPVRYIMQVLSQMAVKHWKTCMFISYAPESTTLFFGRFGMTS